jgi:hypothetical protein
MLLNGLEFTLTVNPSDVHSCILQARLFSHFNINLQEVRVEATVVDYKIRKLL